MNNERKIMCIGNVYSGNCQSGRVYLTDGVAEALSSSGITGGQRAPWIIVEIIDK